MQVINFENQSWLSFLWKAFLIERSLKARQYLVVVYPLPNYLYIISFKSITAHLNQ
jgi:hypothetical protein